MNIQFKIDAQPSTIVVSIVGKLLTLEDTEALVEALDEQPIKNMIIDLSLLEYCSSSGLSFFIRCLTRTQIQQGKLVICGITGNVEKLFEISKLNEIFTFSPTIENGLNFINAN